MRTISTARPSRVKAIWKITKTATREFNQNEGPRMAAALAYYVSFSFVPVLILIIATVALAFARRQVQSSVLSQVQDLLGQASGGIIQKLIQEAWNPSKSIACLVFSLVGALIGATGVLLELKAALNQIWSKEQLLGLGYVFRQRAKFLGVVIAIGFLLTVSLAVTTAIAVFTATLSGSDAAHWLAHGINLVLSVAVLSFLFALMYKYLPDVEISWSLAWSGAFFTAFLFSIGKAGVAAYLGAGVVSSVFGAAGSIFIILLWIYYSCILLYFAAQYMKVWSQSHK